MLELTRRIGQSVRIADQYMLTITSLAPGMAVVSLESPELTVAAALSKGKAYELDIGGETVKLHLISVIRGDARLGFQAPRSINIQRMEREGP